MTENATKEWCWPWAHTWAKWKDIAAREISRTSMPDKAIGMSIKQERRCTRCNHVQLRMEKTTL